MTRAIKSHEDGVMHLRAGELPLGRPTYYGHARVWTACAQTVSIASGLERLPSEVDCMACLAHKDGS